MNSTPEGELTQEGEKKKKKRTNPITAQSALPEVLRQNKERSSHSKERGTNRKSRFIPFKKRNRTMGSVILIPSVFTNRIGNLFVRFQGKRKCGVRGVAHFRPRRGGELKLVGRWHSYFIDKSWPDNSSSTWKQYNRIEYDCFLSRNREFWENLIWFEELKYIYICWKN